VHVKYLLRSIIHNPVRGQQNVEAKRQWKFSVKIAFASSLASIDSLLFAFLSPFPVFFFAQTQKFSFCFISFPVTTQRLMAQSWLVLSHPLFLAEKQFNFPT
jgi:hypothetical protein